MFNKVKVKAPRRTKFNLSYKKLMSCKMGTLYPVLHDVCIPGDIWKIGNQIIIRMLPLTAPVLHEINAYVHYFFIPFRLLWDTNKDTDCFEVFFTGGITGNVAPTVPTWEPEAAARATGTLWDYYGLEPGKDPAGHYPFKMLYQAYMFTWNEYFRDETHQTAVDWRAATAGVSAEYDLKQRCWEKDYFTSALPNQQRGTAPALPISGLTSADWTASTKIGGTDGDKNVVINTTNHQMNVAAAAETDLIAALNDNVVDLSVASTFDISDLRLAFQVQRLLEVGQRVGARFTEYLRGIYVVSPRDDRLQRPEYVGGSKCPVIISEVLQTSKTESGAPQGNLAGHGIAVSGNYCGKYHVQEPGIMLGLLSIMPRTMYQTGIDRQFVLNTKYDYPFPQLVNTSEQPILNGELFITDGSLADNRGVFGYQGRFDEHRQKRNLVCGLMRSNAAGTLHHWHLGRDIDALPSLGSTFITCQTSETDRIFTVTTGDHMIVHFLNRLQVIRPLPYQATPGLIDH